MGFGRIKISGIARKSYDFGVSCRIFSDDSRPCSPCIVEWEQGEVVHRFQGLPDISLFYSFFHVFHHPESDHPSHQVKRDWIIDRKLDGTF